MKQLTKVENDQCSSSSLFPSDLYNIIHPREFGFNFLRKIASFRQDFLPICHHISLKPWL